MSPPVEIESMLDTPLYNAANTRVFWDVDDFPIPENGDLCAFRCKVRRALEMEGYYGSHLTIFAYVSDDKALVDKERRQFVMAEIPLMCVNVEKQSRLSKMILEMLAWAFENPNPNKAILLIVAKDIPEGDTEFGRVLGILAERGYHVFCTVPDDFPLGQLPPAGPAELTWRWTELFDGKYSIEAAFDSDYESDNDADCPLQEKRTKTSTE